MPSFRAVNQVELLFPTSTGIVHRVRKIDELPEDYLGLPLLQDRKDKMKATGRLEVQDTVYLVIERPGFEEFYCIKAVQG